MKRMYSSKQRRIIALAYFHRYGWIAVMMGCVALWPSYMLYTMSVCMFTYSMWSLVGYRFTWRHIYCSYQNASHQKMTPHLIRWQHMKKSDAYGVPMIFLVLAFAVLVVAIKS